MYFNNSQVICDENMVILDVLIGWLGLSMTPGCCKMVQFSLKQTAAFTMTLTY